MYPRCDHVNGIPLALHELVGIIRFPNNLKVFYFSLHPKPRRKTILAVPCSLPVRQVLVMRLPPRTPSWGYLQTVRFFATSVPTPRIPQTIIEKVVQKYSVGLPDGKVVKAGDYVMIRPEHVMTHDNTGPVISKCAFLFSPFKSPLI